MKLLYTNNLTYWVIRSFIQGQRAKLKSGPLYRRFLCYCSSTVDYIEKSQWDSNQAKFPRFENAAYKRLTSVLTAGTISCMLLENFIIFNNVHKNKVLIQFRPYLARCEITPNLIQKFAKQLRDDSSRKKGYQTKIWFLEVHQLIQRSSQIRNRVVRVIKGFQRYFVSF